MEGENCQIMNWKIENLSCWNQALHGKCIESPEIYYLPINFKMKLYPRGTSGQEEHMVVHFSITLKEEEFSADLYFIGADDGSSLCTQRVQSKGNVSVIELPPGPKFEEVTEQNGGNESDRKDQLILRLKSKSVYRYDEHHVCTIIQVFDVTMEVEYSAILKAEEIISEIRHIHDDNDTNIFLKKSKISEGKKIKLYLVLDTGKRFSVKSHMSLMSREGSVLKYENKEHLFLTGETWTFSDSLSMEELSENVSLILNIKIISDKVSHTLRNMYMHLDNVKIISNRYISVCMENSHSDQKTHSVITDNNQENAVGVLSKELMCLYQDQDFSDLQLKCQSVSFPVHRNILSARSTVFKTMLSSDMTEASTGCVDIEDLEAPTLARFLTFLYTGAVEDLQGDSALKLYYAADKYNVPSLKRECARFLSANVCVSSVCDILSIGDKHQDDELTAAAHNFLLRNFNEVLKSKEWKSFMCSEPLLAVKTITDFAEKDFFVGNLNKTFLC